MDSKFREGEYILYQNGDRNQIGKIKCLCTDGARVYYHAGETAALTPYDKMQKIENERCICSASLGKNQMTMSQLSDVISYTRLLSKLVSPLAARQVYGLNHDADISDFLSDLSMALRAGDTLNLDDDEFYSQVFTRMKKGAQQ